MISIPYSTQLVICHLTCMTKKQSTGTQLNGTQLLDQSMTVWIPLHILRFTYTPVERTLHLLPSRRCKIFIPSLSRCSKRCLQHCVNCHLPGRLLDELVDEAKPVLLNALQQESILLRVNNVMEQETRAGQLTSVRGRAGYFKTALSRQRIDWD